MFERPEQRERTAKYHSRLGDSANRREANSWDNLDTIVPLYLLTQAALFRFGFHRQLYCHCILLNKRLLDESLSLITLFLERVLGTGKMRATIHRSHRH